MPMVARSKLNADQLKGWLFQVGARNPDWEEKGEAEVRQ